jgi:GNAT superfamily N-acetyltransferase
MEIKTASLIDIPVIQHIASLTWPIAYAEILLPGQVSYMLNSMYNDVILRQQMQEEGHLFFLCIQNDKPVGFAGVSKVNYLFKGNAQGRNTWKLHKLYVLPDAHKTGAGILLMNTCLQAILANKGNYIILNVNRQNAAYHFYLKKGFEVIEEIDLNIGAGFLMIDYIMGKTLNEADI